MNQLVNIWNIALPIVVLIAVGFISAYEYGKAHGQVWNEKTEWLYEAAEYLVNQQATHENKTGTDKKVDATNALLEQAKLYKAKITPATAKGMIETAYQNTKTSMNMDNSVVTGFKSNTKETE